jgi:gliding motility-associated-like protein
MKKIYILFLLSFLFASLAAQEGIRPGMLEVKLTPAVGQQLEQSAKPLSATNGPLNVGIPALDRVHARYNAVRMEPIFRIGGPYEKRQRRAGLHLWYRVIIDENADVPAAVAEYLSTGAVEKSSPKYQIRQIANVASPSGKAATGDDPIKQPIRPEDPRFGEQWHYFNTGQRSGWVPGVDIRLSEAWDVTRGDPRVIVAVVDGGIDYNHPDLKDNIWPGIGYNFVRNSSNVTADDHGTHVAGTIAAKNNNGVGVSGVAGGWGEAQGALLMSCQIFDDARPYDNADAAAAIQYGADNGALICQNSWGYTWPGSFEQSVRDAINYFIDNAGKDNDGNPKPGTLMNGGIVIFAAGNSNSSATNWYPGMFPEVLTVASIDAKGRRAWYSNYGTAIDITAPGGDTDYDVYQAGVLSTTPNATYDFYQGTSMACPHVSGVAALALSVHGSETFTPDMLRDLLMTSVNPIPTEPLYEQGRMGTGLIDAFKVVAVPATAITVSPDTMSLAIDSTFTLTATKEPASAMSVVSWLSANDNIASVDENTGAVTGMSTGSVYIFAMTDNGLKDSCLVTVVQPVTGLSIQPETLLLDIGDTETITYTIYPADATNQNVRWENTDPLVASLDEHGKVLALAPGETRITITTEDGEWTAFCEVTVNEAPADDPGDDRLKKINVPEGFSPNGDGKNEFLIIKNDAPETFQLRIFDRSGQFQYISTDYRDDWSGTANTGPHSGKKLQPGTYFYTVTIKNSSVKKTGYIVIRY